MRLSAGEERKVRWLWRNIKSLLPRRTYNPWRFGADPDTSPWDDHQSKSKLRAIIDSGEICVDPDKRKGR